MTVQRMLIHVAAIGALGGAMCLAQTGSASGSSTGPGTSMGQEQGSMGQHNPGNMPNQSGEMNQGGSQSTGTSSGSTSGHPGASMGQDQQGMGSSKGSSPSSMSSSTDRTTSSSSGMSGKKSPDAAFIKKAAQGGLAEVQLGNVAQQNGSSDAVKQFGSMMVTDHSTANNELQQIARDKGVALPTSPAPNDQQEMKNLQSKRGATFDKAYAREMVKDHEKDVAEFRNEAQNGKDPEVKAWAQKTLPTLEQHLSKAKQMDSQVASGPSKNPGSMSSPEGSHTHY